MRRVPGADPDVARSRSRRSPTIARDILEGAFRPIWVRGEVTDFKAHRNGHWYFTLRDRMAQIRCVVWSRDHARIPAPPDEGMQVAAFGNLSVYPRGARCSSSSGGSKRRATDCGARRSSRRARGSRPTDCCDPSASVRSRGIPRRVAVVTSPDGAALARHRRGREAPLAGRARSSSFPAAVQGDTAIMDLCRALERVGALGRRRPRDHRPRRRIARRPLGVQRRARRARGRRVSGAHDLRRRARGGHHDLRPGRRRARGDAVGRRGDASSATTRELVAELRGIGRRLSARARPSAWTAPRPICSGMRRRCRTGSSRATERRRVARRGRSAGGCMRSVRSRRSSAATRSRATTDGRALTSATQFRRRHAVRPGAARRRGRRARRPTSEEQTVSFETAAARLEEIVARARIGPDRPRARAHAVRGRRRLSARRDRGAGQGRGARSTTRRARRRHVRGRRICVSDRADETLGALAQRASTRSSATRARPAAHVAAAATPRRDPVQPARRGKRLRGLLLLASYRRAAADAGDASALAAAVEVVHAYSLVHDDLPCMDDDDCAAAAPTVHRAFDVATATVAGRRDGAARGARRRSAPRRRWGSRADTAGQLVAVLMRASGAGGMIGGQLLDLDGEGRRLLGRGARAHSPRQDRRADRRRRS